MIVNWREHAHDNFEFKLEDLGIVAQADQLIEVWDLWTHEMLGEYTKAEVANFGVSKIPGHGNFVFKFVVKDRPTQISVPVVVVPDVVVAPIVEPEVVVEIQSEDIASENSSEDDFKDIPIDDEEFNQN